MNLMFRKNFREGGGAKTSGAGGLKNKKTYQSKRSRDMGMSSPDDYRFRTHIFFAATRGGGFGYQESVEGYYCKFFGDLNISAKDKLIRQAQAINKIQIFFVRVFFLNGRLLSVG